VTSILRSPSMIGRMRTLQRNGECAMTNLAAAFQRTLVAEQNT
jgi:hypothetical protein